jgi:hypothetical protein
VSPQYLTALIRALWTAIPLGGVTALVTYQQVMRWTPALVAGGVAALGVIVTRGGIEGWVDTKAAALAPKPAPPPVIPPIAP